ncbi:exported sulfatase [Salmonella bongori]|nr:exported sulfatase [Salmonella bongori]
MSAKNKLSTEETDLTRRKLLTSAGILAAGGMLSGAVKADEKCAIQEKPAWDKPFYWRNS